MKRALVASMCIVPNSANMLITKMFTLLKNIPMVSSSATFPVVKSLLSRQNCSWVWVCTHARTPCAFAVACSGHTA